MAAFYVDLRELAPRGRIQQVRHLGVIYGLDHAHAQQRAQERYPRAIENPAQFLQVTRMKRPSANSSRYAARRAA